ncbi:MAG TPA: hypothetical protein VG871_11380 [Vicinamibacterales bacterium]|nr:hypothetical protein [Vicinamibacterales bacterium]
MTRVIVWMLAAVVCASTSGLGHTGWDDADGDPIAVHHDHNAHRFKSGSLPASAPDHCLFCHSLRTLGNGLVATHAMVPEGDDAAVARPAVTVLAGRLLDPRAPSRAPPSVLL